MSGGTQRTDLLPAAGCLVCSSIAVASLTFKMVVTRRCSARLCALLIAHGAAGSWEAGQEPVDLGQEVPPGGIALRQQVVAAVEWNQPAFRDQRSQQP